MIKWKRCVAFQRDEQPFRGTICKGPHQLYTSGRNGIDWYRFIIGWPRTHYLSHSSGLLSAEYRQIFLSMDDHLNLAFLQARIGDGLEVAIKKYPTEIISISSQYNSEFEVLKKLQHANIIKLLRHCTGEGEMILVYEYMPNGSLDKIIFSTSSSSHIHGSNLFYIK